MALNIKSRETEQVVRDLAKRTGLSITEAVHQAAVEKLRRMDEDRERRRQAIYEIMERAKAFPVFDSRPADEILGYNDEGTFERLSSIRLR
ncbi:MAG: type II toxin-antitoxin system VapB family antitoxin [Reyranella sp.]|uniref:type II toxin-antitoxin system VapB family antitoxin n=1 Tax=Reyranella sp. TaxID=1929291 RepID=UPI003D0BE42F